MTAWVILFRGVGGVTQLPTAPLREGPTRAGFGRVATYINSGNAVLTTPLPPEHVIQTVADLCSREFGFSKDVYALKADEWARLVDSNPFPEAVSAPTKCMPPCWPESLIRTGSACYARMIRDRTASRWSGA